MELLIAIGCIVFCWIATYIIEIKLNNDDKIKKAQEYADYWKRCYRKEQEHSNLQDVLIETMKRKIQILESRQPYTVNSPIKNIDSSLPPDLMKAIKKAVFYSHPDKGGKAEDFILCNQVYNEMKRKGYH